MDDSINSVNNLAGWISSWLKGTKPKDVFCVGKPDHEFVFATIEDSGFMIDPPDIVEENFLIQCKDPKFNCLSFDFQKSKITLLPALTKERKIACEARDHLMKSLSIFDTFSDKTFESPDIDRILDLLEQQNILGGKDIYNHYDSYYTGGALCKVAEKYLFAKVILDTKTTTQDEKLHLSIQKTYFSGSQSGFRNWLKQKSPRKLLRGTENEKFFPDPRWGIHKSLVNSL